MNSMQDPFGDNAVSNTQKSPSSEEPFDLMAKLEAIVAGPESDLRTALIREMLAGIVKLYEQPIDLLDIKIVNRALKELRYAFRVFQPYEHCLKVSIYGSARTPADDPDFLLAARFGKLLSEHGFMVITGAGPGIMHAGHQGAGKDMSFGVNIMLPFEQSANSTIVDDPKLVHLKYFFTRKLLFVRESQAAAFFPGGFGTMDEAFELLTLIQTGKANVVPIVCLQAQGTDYWDRWMDLISGQLLRRGLISDSDMSLFKIFDNEQSAVEEIQTFYRNFHSYRLVGNQFLVRIRQALTPAQLVEAQSTFQDLCVDGSFSQGQAFPEEQDEQEILHLPRVAFHYHRRDAGRLRQFIDWLNALRSEDSSTKAEN